MFPLFPKMSIFHRNFGFSTLVKVYRWVSKTKSLQFSQKEIIFLFESPQSASGSRKNSKFQICQFRTIWKMWSTIGYFYASLSEMTFCLTCRVWKFAKVPSISSLEFTKVRFFCLKILSKFWLKNIKKRFPGTIICYLKF